MELDNHKNLYAYWGKADTNNNYHLLLYHCLDVAAVANSYLQTHPLLLRNMAVTLNFTEHHTKSLILFFIALHDLGKFSICFQSKVPEILTKLLPLTKVRTSKHRHDVLGQVLWQHKLCDIFIADYVLKNESAELNRAFNLLMGATSGHHGEPPYTINVTLDGFENSTDAAKNFYLAMAEFFLAKQKIDLRHFEDEDIFEQACKNLSMK